MERCAVASPEWADNNAVRFEASKTEAIIFFKRRSHHRCEREARVGTHRVRFNPGATRWLGVWLNSTLNLAENSKRRIGKTRQAEARLLRIVNQYGTPPAAARNPSQKLYREPCSTHRTSPGTEERRSRRSTSRASLGAFHSTPCGIVMAESGFTPVRALLNHRRARFAQRLYARPRGEQGHERVLVVRQRRAPFTAPPFHQVPRRQGRCGRR